MSGRCRSSLILTLAIACMATAATAATASRLSSSTTTFRIAFPEWRATIPFRGTEFAIGSVCALTLTGTLHERTIAKTNGLLVARIAPSALVVICRSGTATLLSATLPWHLRYESFAGTLPNISSVAFTVVGMNFNWEEPILGLRCLYGGTTASPARLIASVSRGAVTSVRWDETVQVRRINGNEFCPAEGTYSGSGAMSELNSATAVTVTLI